MPYTTAIQIEPSTTTTEKCLEAKKPGLYTCIRYASKLIKLGSDIRKHRTLPSEDKHTMEVIPTTLLEKTKSNYNYGDEETVFTLFNEKCDYIPPPPSTTTTAKDCNYTTRVESQLALPSRLRYVVTNPRPALDIVHQLYNNEDEEEEDEEEEEEEKKRNDYASYHPSSYTSQQENARVQTLQKLSGISFTSTVNQPQQQNTAILIKLSPCALAAANAARQRRQKIRVNL